MRRHARHFVRLYLTLVLCLACGLALFNAVIDPYNVYPAIHLTQLLPHKPNNDHRRAKAGLVRQQHGWETLILGSSYAVVGMDATHPALGPGRSFNLGLNGGKLAEQVGTLRYAWQHGHPIKHVVLVYDNQWFFQAAQPSVDYMQSPLNPDYSFIEYQGSNLFGMQATEHAWHAVRQWRDAGPMTDDRFGRRLTPLLPAGKSQRLTFDNFLADPDLQLPIDGDTANLKLFRRFADFCLERDIQLTVLIAPAHVTLLERFDQSGYWPAWLDGQRNLFTLVQSLNAQRPEPPPITLWDFNSLTDYTTEPIPPINDTTTRLNWFWDPGHFTKELGDVMLERAFGASHKITDTFGTQLTPDTIKPYLTNLRGDYESHLQSGTRIVE